MSDPGGRDDEGPLARWSRRKAQARRGREEPRGPEAHDAAPDAEEQAAAPAPDERSEEEILEELGLPAPETLKAGDDFSRFLGAAVPEALRRRALRRLWLSNPVLANLDGLVDYGEDYTDAAMAVPGGLLKTSYEVGRGFAERLESLARQAEAEKGLDGTEVPPRNAGSESAAAPDVGAAGPADAVVAPEGDAMAPEGDADARGADAEAAEQPDSASMEVASRHRDSESAQPVSPPRATRRMSFRFDGS